MYDEYSKTLIDSLPDLPDFDKVECRRYLSKAYFYVLKRDIEIELTQTDMDELNAIKTYLRTLADTLENISVYDTINGVRREISVENACAFVAGEALALLAEIIRVYSQDVSEHDFDDYLTQPDNFVLIEAALLYMIGDYDINAISVIRKIKRPPITITLSNNSINEYKNLLSNLTLICIERLCSGDINFQKDPLPSARFEVINRDTLLENHSLLNLEIRVLFYNKIILALVTYMKWLAGEDNNNLEAALHEIQQIRELLMKSFARNVNTQYSDIYHLSSLLLVVLNRTSQRSVVNSVPYPGDANFALDFKRYLTYRSRGVDGQKGRPFLWPSAIEYIKDCLPGPHHDAVISMPTGSGKSFIAEIAVAHALSKGWVLYLTPTNSLAHQIRRDLSKALSPFNNVKIKAFVGGSEYTSLAGEELDIESESKFVAVMTPEKAALALRMYPEVFKNCSLCVFDECHLLNDDERGITSDILLAQLFKVSGDIRFLLMSAMISNPDQLAEWLRKSNDGRAHAKPIKWRPSRTMRGLLLVDNDQYEINNRTAQVEALKMGPRKVNYPFETPLAIIAGLSGPWSFDGAPDYKISSIPVNFKASVERRDGRVIGTNFESWKNTSSRLLSEALAGKSIPTINFILTSRHHAFSSASKVTTEIPSAISDPDLFPDNIKGLLKIADHEFGMETMLRDLLSRGVSVHSSAMLQVEQSASELMFVNGNTKLMFATGTLAQGLNLPAIAVVIAGTTMGDPREEPDRVAGISRVDSLIVNGFGRASRPGFSNQGLAVLVSDEPYFAPISNVDPTIALRRYRVLGESDALVEVRSPLEQFVTDFSSDGEEFDISSASPVELTLTSLLAEMEEEDNHSGHVLSRTFAAHKTNREITPHLVEQIRSRINTIKSSYLEQPHVPDWLNKAAMKSGKDFFNTLRIWEAYSRIGLVTREEAQGLKVIDWLNIFFKTMSELPPSYVVPILPNESLKSKTILADMLDAVRDSRHVKSLPWQAPEGWADMWEELKQIVYLYMSGQSYATIATMLQRKAATSNGRSSGVNPIPAVFKFIREVIEPLSIDAGCFLAINEIGVFNQEDHTTPDSLKALPLCIRYGCDTLETLAWFRYGIKQRVCAHSLSSIFPINRDISTEQERSTWVRSKRKEWIDGHYDEILPELLLHAKTVIKTGDSF